MLPRVARLALPGGRSSWLVSRLGLQSPGAPLSATVNSPDAPLFLAHLLWTSLTPEGWQTFYPCQHPLCSPLLFPPGSALRPTHFLASHWLPVPRQDLSSDTLDTILAWLWLRAPRWGLLLWCPGMPRFTSSSTARSTDSAATPTAAPSSCHHRAAPQRRSSVSPPAGRKL